MKSIISLVLAGVLASSLVCVDTSTETNTAEANAVIDTAIEIEAHGPDTEDLRTSTH